MKKTFASSMVLRMCGLILLSLTVFAFGCYHLIVQRTVDSLAQSEMQVSAQQLEARTRHLLGSVEDTLRASQAWGRNSHWTGHTEWLSERQQLQRFNEFFFPIIENHGEIASVNMAHESGREILLLHNADGGWVNRLSDPARLGRTTYWFYWDRQRRLIRSETRQQDYDARQRPWFKGAMALANDGKLFWTAPYTFYTTRQIGLTAVSRWTADDGSRFVIGHDVNLSSLASYTGSLPAEQQKTLALLDDQARLLVLPLSDRQQQQALQMQPLATIKNGPLAHGYQHWLRRTQQPGLVSRHNAADQDWFSLFQPMHFGQQLFWIAVIAPQSAFLPGTTGDLLVLVLITVAALVCGGVVALRMARRFALPLQQLAEESARIGRLELALPVSQTARQAPWQEISQLAAAQELMRQQLLSSTSQLQYARTQLEQKVSERTSALLHQVALVEALLDIIPNPIFYKGADSRFIGCNQAYEQAFGINRRDFIGKRVLDLDYLPLADRQHYQQEDEAVIAHCSRVAREEQMQLADGQLHHVLYSVTGFRHQDNTPGGLIGMIVDVSALKLAEQDARAARRIAEAATRAKADFLANMSHEIRTPMNAIIGMTQLALQTGLNPQQRNYLDKVHIAANGLLGLINDILDFSKIEAGKLSCEQTDFMLEDVISQVADLVALRVRDKGLELLFDIATDVPPRLVGDPLRLGQVLNNLVGNAVKFTDQGEITLAVRLEAEDQDQVLLGIEVRDTGIGMSQAEQDNVFHAFTQADSSTTRRYGGTGLGLSICKHIVELMHGDISVSSTPGVGSSFRFTCRLGKAQPQPEQASTLPDIRGMRALVVDDNAAAREVFAHMLQALQLDAEAVDSGPAALQSLQRAQQAGHPYQLALIDWKMPGMDGVETLQQIQASADFPTPACLLATAHDSDSLAQALGQTPVDGILDKPATFSTLLDAIHTACRHQPALVRNNSAPRLDLPQLRQWLQGSRVLLVEDNQTNQEVALELLRQVGIQADLAENGAQALQMADQHDYQLLLMDCQMPVMDGLEASRQLRRQPAHATRKIVAMTANVMAGEEQRCLEAGMDDYIAKPIDIQVFYATLLRHLQPDLPPPLPVSSTAQTPATGNVLLDRNTALLRMGGDHTLYARLLSRFQEREHDAVQRLRQALQQGEKDGARRIVHNLKGLAGNIGADALAAACRHLEYHLDGDGSQREEAIARLQQQLQQLLAHLEQEQAAAPDPASPFIEDSQALISALALQLQDNDIKASRTATALYHALAGHAEADTAQQLSRLAAQYEYDAALQQLEQLAARLQPKPTMQ
ncbi:sensory box histidine kinase/response regulator [Aquitalea magnusonii]|uniref:Sensory/regulatory protein RpfC n=1 Tax=Aquitalea magnusonii TaxID=332411 RepID=A0A3G9GH75_9NEIS|nr:response regulator [Aquitalea magnusonii]BBF85452.1 sensory box histidine kinase/response regulator [Aquitalea magnusonii]